MGQYSDGAINMRIVFVYEPLTSRTNEINSPPHEPKVHATMNSKVIGSQTYGKTLSDSVFFHIVSSIESIIADI